MNDSNSLYSEIEVNLDTAISVGLTEDEYYKVCEFLGRTPTYTEIGVYGVMWSEHCSYKNSIKQLKTLPRSGGRLLVEAGEENAGLVDIGTDSKGNRYAVCFKVESHNHPSAIEPFQGAATGVGGILRDIFSMGARPIASFNSLRFGELDSARTKFLLNGVINGISHYGNCFGVPTVGGEIYFDDCYFDNPLINVMAAGIVRTDRIATAAASGIGNPVFIVGSSTGRDGIHGASLLASREFDEKTEGMRPTVQVGDPFAEKLLVEATLELIKSGVVVGVQDMGAAGISCSTSEMSQRTGVGMKVDLDKVPLREKDMSAYEIMLSESQERMLFVFDKNKVDKAIEICNKWDVPVTQIGVVTGGGMLDISKNCKQVCFMPADSLALGGGAPQYDREAKEPAYIKEANEFDVSKIETKLTTEEIFWKLLQTPTIASKRWVFEQYDSQVRTNTIAIKSDAAILRIKELPGKGIALTTDCNSRYVYLDPYKGTKIAVAEAARNLICVGAKPLAITNCLNFGNPYDPEVYWTFKEAIKGMGETCRLFDTPVTGGNVSFHNESQNRAIYPTPTIGMLGFIDDLDKIIPTGFVNEDDLIYLIGYTYEDDLTQFKLGGSQYLKLIHKDNIGKLPSVDISKELKLQELMLDLITNGFINSAHDISEGGLAINLAEKTILSNNNLAAFIDINEVDLNNNKYNNLLLFGEFQTKIVVTTSEKNIIKLNDLCNQYSMSCVMIGKVQPEVFEIKNVLKTTKDELVKAYNVLSNFMQ